MIKNEEAPDEAGSCHDVTKTQLEGHPFPVAKHTLVCKLKTGLGAIPFRIHLLTGARGTFRASRRAKDSGDPDGCPSLAPLRLPVSPLSREGLHPLFSPFHANIRIYGMFGNKKNFR